MEASWLFYHILSLYLATFTTLFYIWGVGSNPAWYWAWLSWALAWFGWIWYDDVCVWVVVLHINGTRDGSKSSIFHFHWWMRRMKMHFRTTLMFKTCNCPSIHAHCAHTHVRFWGGEGGRWLGGCVFQSEWQLPKSNALAERETQYLLCVSCPWKKTSRQQRHQHISPPKRTDCNWLVFWNIF